MASSLICRSTGDDASASGKVTVGLASHWPRMRYKCQSSNHKGPKRNEHPCLRSNRVWQAVFTQGLSQGFYSGDYKGEAWVPRLSIPPHCGVWSEALPIFFKYVFKSVWFDFVHIKVGYTPQPTSPIPGGVKFHEILAGLTRKLPWKFSLKLSSTISRHLVKNKAKIYYPVNCFCCVISSLCNLKQQRKFSSFNEH